MDLPPRRILLKIAALTFALGATGCYVWKAQEKPTRNHLPGTKSIDSLVTSPRHVSGTERPDYLIAAPQDARIPGTKSIAEPVSSGLKFGEQNRRTPEAVFPPPTPKKVSR